MCIHTYISERLIVIKTFSYTRQEFHYRDEIEFNFVNFMQESSFEVFTNSRSWKDQNGKPEKKIPFGLSAVPCSNARCIGKVYNNLFNILHKPLDSIEQFFLLPHPHNTIQDIY